MRLSSLSSTSSTVFPLAVIRLLARRGVSPVGVVSMWVTELAELASRVLSYSRLDLYGPDRSSRTVGFRPLSRKYLTTTLKGYDMAYVAPSSRRSPTPGGPSGRSVGGSRPK